jgi:hypothetical protein
MDMRAKYRSCGFRGRLWELGQIASNITDKEMKMSEMKHFESIDIIKEKEIIDETLTLSLKCFRDEYVNKFNKEVPVNKKNDIEWIKSQLEKGDEK